MKQQLKYFGLGMLAFATITLFINATVDSTNKYFPFFKVGSTSQNLALPIQTAYAVKLPETVTFAGEQVPLDDPEVRERLDRELTVNAYWQSSTILIFKRANRCFPTIEKILKEENVPDDFKYLCMAESSLDNVSSPAGASGFWQFLSSTGSQYGLLINSQIDERYNLEKATRAACKYLRSAKEATGSWTAAAAGYNMGTAGVNRQQSLQGETAYYHLLLNTETSRYVQRIVAFKIIHQNQKDFGFYLGNEDLYPEFKYKVVQVSGATNWIQFAKDNGTTYKLLRVYNPWIRDMNLTNKEKRTFDVRIPA